MGDANGQGGRAGPLTLDGKVALVTGGSRGMGREMALAFARAGARGVTVTAAAAPDETPADITNELDGVVAEIGASGCPGRALALTADVRRWEDCRSAVVRTVETFGRLDILINNAGKSPRYHGPRGIDFWEADPEGWRLVIDTNVVGPFLMAKAAVPLMREAGWGRIINISKSVDAMHAAHTGAYGPSKAALEAQSLSWAEELADTGVTVNTIAPGGAVDTRFGRGTIRGVGLPPSVIVPIALWLASPLSDGITGCRYDASLWDDGLPVAAAAERCRRPALFPAPANAERTRLALAWRAPGEDRPIDGGS